jgi:hypothetical protein
MELIYHYTSGQHLDKIIKSGFLKVSEWEIKNKIKPAALWLSKNTIWENTATKAVLSCGEIRQLTLLEQHEMFGLIRFVLKFHKDRFCSWAKYKHLSNTPINVYRQMEIEGVRQGSNPIDWYASFMNIPLSKCISIEKWDGISWQFLIDPLNKL